MRSGVLQPKRLSEPRLNMAMLLLALLASVWRILFYMPRKLDEYEHWHNAVLIAKYHLEPLRDYFEHHLPLFWNLLALGFRLGLPADELHPLIAGRILTAVCFGLSLVLLLKISQRLIKSPDAGTSVPSIVFALIFAIQHDTFVLRPEVVAIPLLLAGVLTSTTRLYSFSSAAGFGALTGLFFGLSVAFSPRFVYALPILVFFVGLHAQNRKKTIVWLGATGAVTAAVLIVSALPNPLLVWHWAFEFNSALFKIKPLTFGRADKASVLNGHILGQLGTIFVIGFYLLSKNRKDPVKIVAVVIIAAIGLISLWGGATSHPTHQTFAVLSVLACVVLGLLLPSVSALYRKVFAVGFALFTLAISGLVCVRSGELVDTLEQRYYLASLINSGDHLYVCPDLRPISQHVPAFYYEVLPFPNRFRLKAALNRLGNPSWAPPLDTINDLVHTKPKVIDLGCLAPNKEELNRLSAALANCYELAWLATPFRNGISPVLIRKERCKPVKP